MVFHLGLLKVRLSRAIQFLFYIFYPTSCIACGDLIAYAAVLCCRCWGDIKPITSVYLPLKKNTEMPVYAATAYQDPIKKLVLAKFLYHYVASKQLAQIMLELLPKKSFEVDYLVPIPLHWSRHMWRGYNQSLVIAQYLSKNTGIPVLHALRRPRRTLYQWRCDKTGRLDNIRDAFVVSAQGKVLENKRVLLIDDLCTTGGTLQSAAKTLLQVQPSQISAAVGCRAL